MLQSTPHLKSSVRVPRETINKDRDKHGRRDAALLDHRERALGRVDALGDTADRVEDVREALAFAEPEPDGEVARLLGRAREEEVPDAGEREEPARFFWGGGPSRQSRNVSSKAACEKTDVSGSASYATPILVISDNERVTSPVRDWDE